MINQVAIGPYRYDIEFEDIDTEEASVWGNFDHIRQRIQINTTGKIDRQRVALMHELLHCVFHLYGAPSMQRSKEEDLLAVIAPALVDLLLQNPDLVDFLTEMRRNEY